MDLVEARIKNFRSIEDVRIAFTQRCRTLVGINESGKSNILRALERLSPECKSDRSRDVRWALPGRKETTESWIWFVFRFNSRELDQIHEWVDENVAFPDWESPIAYDGPKALNLSEFCRTYSEGILVTKLIGGERYNTSWEASSSLTIDKNICKPSSECPSDYTIYLGDDSVKLRGYKLFDRRSFPEIPSDFLTTATIQDLHKLVRGSISRMMNGALPNVIFWEYKEANVLPPRVNMATFSANPDSCIPLKNMFLLAGYADITDAFAKALGAPRNYLSNLLANVAVQSTREFRKVWREHKSVEFKLDPDGEFINIGIKERNQFDMSMRSDGFKRFVTFLLLISASVRAGNLHDTLLLIDEPDITLHPSGARFLLQELLRISKSNWVVFSTHSIFMIDRDNIARHYIVKKEKETTRVEEACESRILDDEVLYRALGYSIFEVLKRKNVIFEGWRDKKLFEEAVKRLPSEIAQLGPKLSEIGLCYAQGLKDIRNITPIIQAGMRDCVIVTDSDTFAVQMQREHIKEKGHGEWLRYDELAEIDGCVTGEDFLAEPYFRARTELLSSKDVRLRGIGEADLSGKGGRLAGLERWFASNGIAAADRKALLNDIKNQLFAELDADGIDPRYYLIVKALLERV